MFRDQLRAWASHFHQRLKDFWLVWLIGGISALFWDRVTSGANAWLDTNAPPVFISVWNSMSFLPHSELGYMVWLFALTIVGIVVLAYYDTRLSKTKVVPVLQSLSPPRDEKVEGTIQSVPPSVQVSPQDAANRKKIVALVRVHVNPVHTVALVVTQGLFGQLHGSDDAKRRTIYLLLKAYVVHSCNAASEDLNRAVRSSDVNVEGLRQRLWEFLEAYQKLVCWTNHLAEHLDISPSKDPGYGVWQEKHKMFYQKLIELIAANDFFILPENLRGDWSDIKR